MLIDNWNNTFKKCFRGRNRIELDHSFLDRKGQGFKIKKMCTVEMTWQLYKERTSSKRNVLDLNVYAVQTVVQ